MPPGRREGARRVRTRKGRGGGGVALGARAPPVPPRSPPLVPARTSTSPSPHSLPSAPQAEKKRQERLNQTLAERTIDAQRASAPVPRDTVQLYAQLRESGLQYGPAFRLLRNVHVPDVNA